MSKVIIRKKKARSDRRAGRFFSGKIIEWGILGLIVWSPLAAGSVHEWSILVIQLVVLVMMGAYVLMRNKPETNTLLSSSLKWPKVLFYGLFIFLIFQIMPLPAFLVKIISPQSYLLRQVYVGDFSGSGFMSLSVVPANSLRELLEFISYFFFGFLIIKTVTSSRQIKRIIYVLVAMGAFEAFYGLFELYNSNPRILFYKKVFGLDSVSGTFVNRNHFSGYLEMIIPLAIGLVIARIDLFSFARMRWKEKIMRLSEKGLAKNLVITCSIIIMSWAILFSRSRSGVFLLVFTFILLFEFIVLYFRKSLFHQEWMKGFIIIVLLAVTFSSLYVGIGATLERFDLDKILATNRPLYWSNTSRISSDFRLAGSGLGTFASVYPVYEERKTSGYISHAHNDYIEYLSELGWMGMILLMGGIIYILGASFFVWKERRRPDVKGLALGGLIAVLAILLHSISDFNLHIPANMLLFAGVLSLTAVTAFYRFQEPPAERKNNIINRNQGNIKFLLYNSKKSNIRKGFIVLLLAGIAILDVAVYWNQHLYYRAEKALDQNEKIRTLEIAKKVYSGNELIYYALGEAYFELAVQESEDMEKMALFLEQSIQGYTRAIELNPVNRFSHFNYAQAVEKLGYVRPGKLTGEELSETVNAGYIRAARLAGHNNQIYFEVGRLLFSRWAELSQKNRDFAVECLREIISQKDRERFRNLMHVWEMNIKDYSIMETILPEDIQIYRMYARFLGEKSLSLEERQKILCKAETMEFARAREVYVTGENAFRYGRIEEAARHYGSFINIGKRIKFYQNLTGNSAIDAGLFYQMKKTAYLKLAQCRIAEGKGLKGAREYLYNYLALEDKLAGLNELEKFLVDRKILPDKPDSAFENLELLSFQMRLYFRQNRYREIMSVGSMLERSFVVVPEEMKKEYAGILGIVGDALQKAGYLYEASRFYEKGLEADARNLDILLGLRRNCDRLGREKLDVEQKIAEITGFGKAKITDVRIKKGRQYTRKTSLDGSETKLVLHVLGEEGMTAPLLTVEFNGQVVWENYVKDSIISIPVNTETGVNSFVVFPVNCDIMLKKVQVMK